MIKSFIQNELTHMCAMCLKIDAENARGLFRVAADIMC